jgi:hypothetical protein
MLIQNAQRNFLSEWISAALHTHPRLGEALHLRSAAMVNFVLPFSLATLVSATSAYVKYSEGNPIYLSAEHPEDKVALFEGKYTRRAGEWANGKPTFECGGQRIQYVRVRDLGGDSFRWIVTPNGVSTLIKQLELSTDTLQAHVMGPINDTAHTPLDSVGTWFVVLETRWVEATLFWSAFQQVSHPPKSLVPRSGIS